MLQFPIPPEYCLIVNAFSQATTLRQAALLLQTDPAGLVRKVQKISSEYGFLQKVGNRWVVTESGKRVAHWSEEFISGQKELIDQSPRFRMAAFSWLTEEMLIPQYPKLKSLNRSEMSWSFKMTPTDLEQELVNNRSDFVITGHAPNDPAVAHKKISRYPWVVIVPYSWKKNLAGFKENELIEFLNSKPFVRHAGLNPAKLFQFVPETQSELVIDGVVGLRAAVVAELGWSAVPAMSVVSFLKDKKLSKLEIPTSIVDEVSIWWLRARKDSAAQIKNLTKWISEFEVG